MLLTWIWGIGNNVWISLLMFVSLVNLAVPFVLDARGSEWAWRSKRWKSAEHFQAVQRKWAIWGFSTLAMFVVAAVAAVVLAASSLSGSELYQGAERTLRANPGTMAILGEPVETGFPGGQVRVQGDNGRPTSASQPRDPNPRGRLEPRRRGSTEAGFSSTSSFARRTADESSCSRRPSKIQPRAAGRLRRSSTSKALIRAVRVKTELIALSLRSSSSSSPFRRRAGRPGPLSR